MGILTDRIGPKKTGLIGQLIVLIPSPGGGAIAMTCPN